MFTQDLYISSPPSPGTHQKSCRLQYCTFDWTETVTMLARFAGMAKLSAKSNVRPLASNSLPQYSSIFSTVTGTFKCLYYCKDKKVKACLLVKVTCKLLIHLYQMSFQCLVLHIKLKKKKQTKNVSLLQYNGQWFVVRHFWV